MTSPWPPIGPPATPAGRPAGPPAREPMLASKFCTNWSQYGLDAIWEMVRGEDGRINGQQAQAWNRMLTLCNHQADRLLKAAAQLAERWPPHRSEAAAAFVEYVSRMANSMQEAATAAGRNMTALEQLGNGIGAARVEVATLLAQRYQYQQREAQRDEYLRTHRAAAGKVGFVPTTVPEALMVPSNWRADLDERARQIMQGTETLAAQAGGHMTVPPEYSPQVRFDEAENKNGPGTIAGLPRSSGLGRGIPPPIFDPPSLIFGGSSGQPADPGYLGPVLDSSQPSYGPSSSAPTPPMTGAGLPGLPYGVPAGVGPGPGVTPMVAVPPPGRVFSGPANAPTNAAKLESPRGSATRPSTVVSGPMPMVPPPIMARPGHSPSPAAGRAASGSGAAVVGGSRRGSAGPDDPWAVRQGVKAVLEPDVEPESYDPGPGVIGMHR